MSDALDSAASAFDVAIGARTPAASNDDGGSSRAPEQMFSNLGELDADSPEAGGDTSPLEGVNPVSRGNRKPVVLDDEPDTEVDEDEITYQVDDEGELLLDDEGNPIPVEKEDAPDEDDDDADDVFKVTIDGVEEEVPLREALDGYIRKQTFDRRMSYLNETKKVIHAEGVKVVQQRDTYVKKLEEADKLLQALVPAEPDWVAEYRANPEAAALLQKQYNQFQAQREAIKSEIAKTQQEEQTETAEQRAERIRASNAQILTDHPSWKDQKVMKRDLSNMAETARNAGFSDEEIMETTDPRMVKILVKAMKYDRLKAAKPTPVRRGTKPVTPGAGSTRTAPRGVDKAQKQLRRTGSVEDAGAVFTSMLRSK